MRQSVHVNKCGRLYAATGYIDGTEVFLECGTLRGVFDLAVDAGFKPDEIHFCGGMEDHIAAGKVGYPGSLNHVRFE